MHPFPSLSVIASLAAIVLTLPRAAIAVLRGERLDEPGDCSKTEQSESGQSAAGVSEPIAIVAQCKCN